MASSFGGTIKLQQESEYKKALSSICDNLKVLSSEMKVVTSQYDKNDSSSKKLKESNEVLTKKIHEQEEKVKILKNALEASKKETDENSTTTKKWQNELNNAQAELNQMNRELNKSSDNLEEAGQNALKFGDIIKANLISDAIKSGISTLANGIKELGNAFISVGKQSLESYGNYEQLVGGVDTLFGESSKKVQEYANNAYKTAGLSANEYMETVTSFSASLLQSLNGDTSKSAEVADMAITDMADNANKMGTSMESIQNAYQGFAKQNYTMLDNLKLGYGGTKSEMERLLSDATKISGVEYDIASLNDVYNAIHVIQGELKITGTTAKEASSTIQGSINATKSAWQNMLTGLANGNADITQLLYNLIDGIMTVSQNVIPVAEQITNSIIELLPGVLDAILEQLDNFLDAGVRIIKALVSGITSNMPLIMTVVMEITKALVETIIENLPMILQAGITILVELVKGIAQSLPTLIPTIMDALLLMVETLIDNIDLIIDAGIQLTLGIAEGLINALPVLIDKIPIIIDKLVNAIVNNLPKIIETGIRLQLELAKGLIQAIPQLVSKIPQIISSLVSGLLNGISAVKDVGRHLISGLWEGIKEKWDSLKSAVSNFGSGIVNKFKSVFGIHSPSKVFKEQIGTNLALGIEEGFGDTMSDVAQNMSNMIPTDFDTDINLNSNSANSLNYNTLVNAFKEALKDTKVVMNGREMGSFVSDVVERVVYP